MSRRSPTWISPGMIMSSPGVPWQAWDSHRGQISQIHQRLRPIFKWRCPPPPPLPPPRHILHIFIPKFEGCLEAAAGLLNAEPDSWLRPVSDLDSGCIQPSSVGNPVSYPLHLALLLRVSFYTLPSPTPGCLTHIWASRGILVVAPCVVSDILWQQAPELKSP